jgi:hypothetical protein
MWLCEKIKATALWVWAKSTPELVTAWATAIGLIITIVLFAKTMHEQREVTSATLMVSLADHWRSERMAAYRKRLAQDLLAAPKKMPSDSEVLDFFENIGHLTKRGYLDEKMVWNLFVWELSCYYKAVTGDQNLIEAERKRYGHQAIYSELEWLYHRFVEIDKQTNNNSQKPSKLVEPDKNDIDEFLNDEKKGLKDDD